MRELLLGVVPFVILAVLVFGFAGGPDPDGLA